jgi:hypothetical protein
VCRYIGLLFDSIDEEITYARQPKYRTQLKHILAEHRRYDELAEEYLVDKSLVDAVKYFVKSYQTHQTRTSVIRAVDVTISYTESVLLIEGIYRKSDQDLAQALIEKVHPFAIFASREAALKVNVILHSKQCPRPLTTRYMCYRLTYFMSTRALIMSAPRLPEHGTKLVKPTDTCEH